MQKKPSSINRPLLHSLPGEFPKLCPFHNPMDFPKIIYKENLLEMRGFPKQSKIRYDSICFDHFMNEREFPLKTSPSTQTLA